MRATPQRVVVAALAFLAFGASLSPGAAQSAGAVVEPGAALTGTIHFETLDLPGPDPECEPGVRQRGVRSRTPGPLSWLFRFDRPEVIDRDERPFAFYLRSPLLSGLFGCPPRSTAGGTAPEPVDECAELTITNQHFEEHKIQVLLPQFDSRNAKRLRNHIEERLRRGHPVTVIMTGGEPYSIIPEFTQGVEARACRRGVWNEQ